MEGNAKLFEQVAKISAETAVQVTLEHLEKVRQEDEKTKRDKRLRNTRLLLRNYRSFKLHCWDIEEELVAIETTGVLDDLIADEFAVESIKRSKERTLSMVRFIDQMLIVYKTICEQSNKSEDIRKYEVIFDLYISSAKKTYEEIAECHKIHVRTVHRDVTEAVKALSVLVFGVDGIRMIS